MRPPHDPPRRRRTAPVVALTALVGALLLVPGSALASPETSAPCDDPLVTYSRDGAQGDPHTVALTAQSLERDVPGWSHVTWSAASGTTLSAVYATDADGGVTALGASATGTATDVAALIFCGSAQPVTAGADEPTEAVVGSEEGVADEDDEVSIRVEFEPEAIIELEEDGEDGEGEGDDDSAGVVSADDDEGERTSNPPSGNEATTDDEARTSNPPSGNEATTSRDTTGGGTAAPEVDAGDVEVLGVKLVAAADGSRGEASDRADTAAATDDMDSPTGPIVAQAATSSTDGSAAPILPLSVRILLTLAALLGVAAAIRASRTTEVSR